MSRLTILLTLLLALAAPAVAKDKGDDKGSHDSRESYQHRPGVYDGTFSSAERNLIRSWLQE